MPAASLPASMKAEEVPSMKVAAEEMVTPTHGPERPQNAATFLLSRSAPALALSHEGCREEAALPSSKLVQFDLSSAFNQSRKLSRRWLRNEI